MVKVPFVVNLTSPFTKCKILITETRTKRIFMLSWHINQWKIEHTAFMNLQQDTGVWVEWVEAVRIFLEITVYFNFPAAPNSSLLTLIMELFTLHTGGSRETIYPNLVTMCDALWRDVTQYWRHTARKCLNLLRSDSILLRLWLHSFNIRNFWHCSEMLHQREDTVQWEIIRQRNWGLWAIWAELSDSKQGRAGQVSVLRL